MIIAYSSNIIPEGYLLCDGSEINRITYSELFNVIGIIYGEGNNETTFNLPNLINKFIQGNDIVGTYINAGLPNIEGWFLPDGQRGCVIVDNVLFTKKDGPSSYNIGSTGNNGQQIDFDASRFNSIYGSSSTVQPESLTMKYIIKAY